MRVTKKLRQAAEALSLEEFGDCFPEEILQAVATGRVSREQVYRTARGQGLRWNGRAWLRELPAWLLGFRG